MCGRYASQTAIQEACDEDPSCKSYTYSPTSGTYSRGWWCMKTVAEFGQQEDGAVLYIRRPLPSDYYQIVGYGGVVIAYPPNET